MKKYITAAALLAAGTALANAVALDDAFFSALGSDVSATMDLTSIEGNNSVNFSVTYTIDPALFASVLASAPTASATSSPTLVSVNAGSNRNYGTTIGFGSANNAINRVGVYTTELTASAGTYAAKRSNKDTDFRQGSYEIGTLDSLVSVDELVGVAVTLSYSNSNTGSTLYVTTLDKKGNATTTATADADLRWTSNSQVPQAVNVNTGAKITSVYVFNSTLSATDAAAVNSAAISAIPEPSAFGLLAGIGALALVAARRRRKA